MTDMSTRVGFELVPQKQIPVTVDTHINARLKRVLTLDRMKKIQCFDMTWPVLKQYL